MRETDATRALARLFSEISQKKENGKLFLTVHFAQGTPAGRVEHQWIGRSQFPGTAESGNGPRQPPRDSDLS